jgi:hypothetical protein
MLRKFIITLDTVDVELQAHTVDTEGAAAVFVQDGLTPEDPSIVVGIFREYRGIFDASAGRFVDQPKQKKRWPFA